MKQIGLALAAVTAFAGQNLSAQLAGTATISEIGVGNATGGGVFQAVTSGFGTFDTFCISISTQVSLDHQYNYLVSPTPDWATPIPSGYPQSPDAYISFGTAYIYDQFLKGAAAYGGTLDTATVNNVQYTIWYLQGLLNGYQDPRGNTSGYDYSAGVTSILNSIYHTTTYKLADLLADGNGAFGVEALNLYDGVKQPQLIEVPEPTTVVAGALLLLPFGASTLRLLRKNRAA